MRPLTDAEIGELTARIGYYGNATVLWVEVADDAHPPGFVERIGPTLMKAYIDRFAPGENAHDLSIECWITLCRNAYELWKRA
jgi:hypothetical protein